MRKKNQRSSPERAATYCRTSDDREDRGLGVARQEAECRARAEEVEVHPLDEQVAYAAGQLCGATGTADVVDASVVLVTRDRDGVVVSSDAGDMKRLDPGISVVAC